MRLKRFRTRLAALALLTQAVTVFAWTTGLVVCTSAGGHAEIEYRSDTARCCPETAPTPSASIGSDRRCSTEACVDAPALGPAFGTSAPSLAYAAAVLALVVDEELPRASFARLPADLHPPRSREHSPQTTVLLI